MLEALVEAVFAAASSAGAEEDTAAEITRRVLVADPHGRPDALAARGACLAAGRVPAYAGIDAPERDALVLATALGWKTDRIATQLGTTPQDVTARIGRGLRTLLPPRDCAAAASPAHGARAS
ncbi:hypothetical protein DVA67_009745 [Solirubrobacter sp. CPCC 204708]|uniref:Sigma-70 region 4 domain-containing protein n=1 Tax=Solirubrobacter deserti TaxID=2282478 RepID=A0ABT4RTZ9_9ACTN|nr:hypothetical protein [Solirubrobacter deserti]MBE2316258.1 hypothetical protein [Solirubrobacter deserti]MDA0142062.1 sigma-70 region 4 domain-containing protein [Solirubrobacter deserti]